MHDLPKVTQAEEMLEPGFKPLPPPEALVAEEQVTRSGGNML